MKFNGIVASARFAEEQRSRWKNEDPTPSLTMLNGESCEVQLEIASQFRPTLLTNHGATLRELARLLR